jgi:hypothetical protein
MGTEKDKPVASGRSGHILGGHDWVYVLALLIPFVARVETTYEAPKVK